MADPIITPQLLAAVGAGAGALMKPRNPLQGALLGGIAGYTGGTALGVGSTPIGGGTGLTAGLGDGVGLGTSGASGLNASNALGGTQYALGNAGTSNALGMSAVPSSSGYLLADTAATPSALTPSLAERLSMAGSSAYENPMMTASALQATQGLLTPDQQIHASPGQVSYGKGQGQPVDWNAALNPNKQTLSQNKPISLI